jgi:hypothetical protein
MGDEVTNPGGGLVVKRSSFEDVELSRDSCDVLTPFEYNRLGGGLRLRCGDEMFGPCKG